jgi:hypothetical protein
MHPDKNFVVGSGQYFSARSLHCISRITSVNTTWLVLAFNDSLAHNCI